jgi:hypothetical protein
MGGRTSLHHIIITHTSFIIMSNKGRLPASGLGARGEYSSMHFQFWVRTVCFDTNVMLAAQ